MAFPTIVYSNDLTTFHINHTQSCLAISEFSVGGMLRCPEAQKSEAGASYTVRAFKSLSGRRSLDICSRARRQLWDAAESFPERLTWAQASTANHLLRPHQPSAVSRSVITLTCCDWLASHLKRLRPTTHSVWRWIQLLPYLSWTLPGGHIPFSIFFFWTGHCLFWLLVPDNISLLFHDAEETRVWERTDWTCKECIAVCVHNKHKHLGKCDDWRLELD